MSFEPITYWALRCDGDTTRGQCERRHDYEPWEDELDERVLTTWSDPTDLDAAQRRAVSDSGWLWLPDGRVLCPAHLAGRAEMVRAALEGLPFPDTTTSGFRTDTGENA